MCDPSIYVVPGEVIARTERILGICLWGLDVMEIER
jgi:hypothetical protein